MNNFIFDEGMSRLVVVPFAISKTKTCLQYHAIVLYVSDGKTVAKSLLGPYASAELLTCGIWETIQLVIPAIKVKSLPNTLMCQLRTFCPRNDLGEGMVCSAFPDVNLAKQVILLEQSEIISIHAHLAIWLTDSG